MKTSARRCASVASALVSLAAALAAACGSPPPPEAAKDVVRPVEILTVSASRLDPDLRFPGRVRAVHRAELTFNVSGQLVELPVDQGRRVEQGQLIARIDPKPFQLRLQSARAQYDKARAEHERVQTLWDEGVVSRNELDAKRTAMEVARSAFATARESLDDTRLQAPFDGVIARRYVENFQNVRAKEPIVSLQDTDRLEIVIHVPERLIRSQPKRVAGFATFDDAPGRRYPVRLSSYASEADPQTQTYEVVLGVASPADLTVLPGMPVTVHPDSAAADDGHAGAVTVPLGAIVSAGDQGPSVWVFDPQSSAVSRRSIRTGEPQGDQVRVLEGLEPGERIVTTGVHHLFEGMRVRPMQGG